MTLRVLELGVRIGDTQVLHDVSFTIENGERLGLIGASGSGKTILALAVAGLLPEGAITSGRIELDGVNLLTMTEPELAAIRGDAIGFVFQEPKSALNPLIPLGKQITESLNIHYQLSKSQRTEAAYKLAERVGLDQPSELLRSYPHQVSGGQRQRVAIAAAIATSPSVLIADEPTTALDVTVQHEILQLLRTLNTTEMMGMLFITHDLAVLSQVADCALVLDKGTVIERGTVEQITSAPEHPITQALVTAARLSERPQPGQAENS